MDIHLRGPWRQWYFRWRSCALRGGSGGAWRTLKYVKKQGKTYINLHDQREKAEYKTERHSEKVYELHKLSIYFLVRICYHILVYA